MSKIIIIRGNSGSGKTHLANALNVHLDQQTLMLHQDSLKREFLSTHETPGHLTPSLINANIDWACDHNLDVILEGILDYKHYQAVFDHIQHLSVIAVYLNQTFEQTLAKNALKEVPFSSKQLADWWLPTGGAPLPIPETFFPTQWRTLEQINWICSKMN